MRAVAEYIGRSDLQPGDCLPAERVLMTELSVGRSTLREVIRHWQALGVVESRRGSGTYLLRRISPETMHLPLAVDTGRNGLLQMMEVRRGLEVEASALAAVRASADDLALIESKLQTMEAVHREKGCAGQEDLEFHLSIYDACGNPLFGQLLSQLRESVQALFSMSRLRTDFAARSFPFHRELFEAIAAKDPDAARAKTLSILAIVEEDIKDMIT
ncbi:FadR/GntR family transcriptional regulator [Microvirga sp. KLBC 81]|uniref:FadR/GntR family transcriptional regulator n=1 Tax=Microvirga sp. KLBC 81 TaxID=1862707 RepID=UPI0014025B83